MASKTIEAKLVISGEDRASSEIAKVVKAMKEAEKASAFSDKVERLGKAYNSVERQMRAATAVMSARGPLEATVKNLAAVERETTRLAKEYDTARKAVTDFVAAQKVAKTADSVQQAAALSAEVKRLGTAYRAAEKDVKQLNAAFASQTSTLRAAESAASRLGVDLSSLERHQAGLARQTDLATRALRAQMAAEEAGARAASARAQRTAARRDAIGTVVGGAGVIAAHKGRQIGIEAVDQAASFDYAKRYQVVAGGVSEQAQRTKLLPQALRIGQETKFTNEDIVEAQTATLQGLPMKGDAKAAVAAAIVENVKNYAVMMRAPMEASAQGIRAFLQTSQKDISTEEKAVFEAKRASNLLVKMAKLGGMKDNDVQDYITYGVPTGTSAGLSDTTLAALGAAGKRSGLGGSETGVFIRAAASKLVAPTRGGLDALRAAGINYNDFTKMPDGLSVNNLEAFSKNRFGKGFSASQRARLEDLLEDGDVIGDRTEFTKKVSEVVQEGFAKNKKGKTSAQDARNIAKMLGDFHKLSVESVNAEGLLDTILSNPKMTQALRNAFFTDKHGGKASVLSSQYEQFSKDREELKNLQAHDPNFAANAAKYMSEGLGGTIDNLKGSWETLVLNISEANSGLIKFAAEGLSSGTDMFSNLSRTSQQVISLVGGAAAVSGGVYGAAKIGGKLLGFGGGAAALNGSAVALNAAAAALTEAAVLQGAKGALPEVAKKGGKLLPLIAGAGVVGGAAAGIGYVLSEYGDASKAVAAGGKPDPGVQMNPGDELPGLSGSNDAPSWVARKAPSMTLAPGAMPLTIQGTGIGGFGLSGPVNPEAAGKEAGEKVGTGVADGIKAKAGEVIEQGRSLLQKLNEQFREGIFVPINFAPGAGMGGGGGLIQRASFSPGGSFGAGVGTGIGSGGGGGGGLSPGGGGSGSGRTVPRGAFGPSRGAGDSWFEAVMRAEGTAGKDPYNVVLGNGRYGLPNKPLTDMSLAEAYKFGRSVRARHGSSSALGAFQIVGQTMKTFMGEAGLGWDDKFSPENQRKLADVIRRRQGFGAWEGFKVHRGELGNARRLGAYQGASDGEPRLVKGLDGKEGLDLGNGTMKMPDGSIRSIVPAAPAGGIGGAGGGRGSIGAAAERMNQAVDKMEGMGFHGQISLAVTGSGRQQVRATALKVRGRGGMTADLGISEPGAKEDLSDWT
ncbi:MAG: phage tail tape measure protein [Parafilimonas terrae]|nr:phage tail tape measure protein [Parafilimonas terrae]